MCPVYSVSTRLMLVTSLRLHNLIADLDSILPSVSKWKFLCNLGDLGSVPIEQVVFYRKIYYSEHVYSAFVLMEESTSIGSGSGCGFSIVSFGGMSFGF